MKRNLITSLAISLFAVGALDSCASTPDYGRALDSGADALIPVDPDEVPDFSVDWAERDSLLPALDLSIQWTLRQHAEQFFPIAGITHARSLESLERFREILLACTSGKAFQESIEREFQVYRSAGWDGRGGGVLFTAYCTPVLRGSLERNSTFAYPLYGLPSDLVKAADGSVLGWDTAFGRMPRYPSRGAIESGSLLAGRSLELAWLRDPIDAYLAHVNGSAVIELTDGSQLRLGYAGKNGRPYASLGKALVADGKLPADGANLANIRAWAAGVSELELASYLARNESYVFFTAIDGNPHGSLDVEVTRERSIATDKTLSPRGAMVFVTPNDPANTAAPMNRFYMDQDTGGAIRTAGRADLYLGIGDAAEELAGRTKAEGQMYYLFLREGRRN